MKSSLMLFILFFIILSGCKDETKPPSSEPQPLVQTAPADDEKAVNVESGAYVTAPDEAGGVESEAYDDNKENSLPEIVSLKLIPQVIYPGTTVIAKAEGRDNEEEDVTFYYRWQKNEEFLPGEEDEELDTTGFSKGDLITAFVTPFDGENEGKQVMSPSLLVSNRPPDITSAPVGNIVDGMFIYKVEASDPDGDELKFSLEGSPAAMTIDAGGRVEWKVPIDAKGPFSVKVVVSDGDATTFQGFNIGGIEVERR
ncbi:MAG: hypothetical protein RQ824_08275 [bacterium]|nr:hypothetical protein [bacterium]